MKTEKPKLIIPRWIKVAGITSLPTKKKLSDFIQIAQEIEALNQKMKLDERYNQLNPKMDKSKDY